MDLRQCGGAGQAQDRTQLTRGLEFLHGLDQPQPKNIGNLQSHRLPKKHSPLQKKIFKAHDPREK